MKLKPRRRRTQRGKSARRARAPRPPAPTRPRGAPAPPPGAPPPAPDLLDGNPIPEDGGRMSFTWEISELDGGLRVVTTPVPTAQSVSVNVFVGAGSRAAEERAEGVARR